MTATADHAERQRRASNKDRILEFLLEHGSATNAQLAQVGGLRFGGRLFDLRAEGWAIETADLGKGLVKYTLLRPVKPATVQQVLFG